MQFEAEVDAGWTIAGKPNGGYLLMLMARPAAELTDHEHVIAASAHYLRSPDPGPVTITAEVLRPGRTASQVRAQLAQGGKTCVEALMTVADLDPNAEPYWDAGMPALDIAPRDQCERVRQAELPIPLLDTVDVRIDPATGGFLRGEPSGRGALQGWLALPDDQPFDPAALLFAVDAFPPAARDIGPIGWVPTLELTAYVRAVPAPGPVQVLQRAGLIREQRFDESCFVWDSEGTLVAHATQLAGIRLG